MEVLCQTILLYEVVKTSGVDMLDTVSMDNDATQQRSFFARKADNLLIQNLTSSLQNVWLLALSCL